ncbi:MAG: DNA alkylation repair protein, partial [Clostridia bacterium]|nr:DNA alkylation repair protein [Clostridia bacterium]
MLYIKEEVEKFLKDNADEKYRDFHSRLTRSNYPINGVRVPILRAYGKSLATRDNVTEFLQSESKYYEEIMLKGIVLS